MARHWDNGVTKNVEKSLDAFWALDPGSMVRLWDGEKFSYHIRTLNGWRLGTRDGHWFAPDKTFKVKVNDDYERTTCAVDLDAAREYAICMYRAVTNDQGPVCTSIQLID